MTMRFDTREAASQYARENNFRFVWWHAYKIKGGFYFVNNTLDHNDDDDYFILEV